MLKLLCEAGMASSEAKVNLRQFESKHRAIQKGMVSFDRFFREYVRMQCFKTVMHVTSAETKGREARKTQQTTHLDAKLPRRKIVENFARFFTEEDAEEVVASVFRFLRKGPTALTPKEIQTWYLEAYRVSSAKKKKTKEGKTLTEKDRIEGWRRWMKTYTCLGDVTLVIKGTKKKPTCGFSLRAVLALVRAGVEFETFDITKTQSSFQQWWKAEAKWATFPQLWVKGSLFGGLDVIEEYVEEDALWGELQKKGASKLAAVVDEALVARLTSLQAQMDAAAAAAAAKRNADGSGCAAGEAGQQATCASSSRRESKTTAACAGDDARMSAEDSLLVSVLSRKGTADWSAVHQVLAEKDPKRFAAKTPGDVRAQWERVKPLVSAQMKADVEMACGHSCSTCPTRSTCALHDIEDIM